MFGLMEWSFLLMLGLNLKEKSKPFKIIYGIAVTLGAVNLLLYLI